MMSALIVSMDFDGTLQRSSWDAERGWIDGPPNDEMICRLRTYSDEGAQVYIVTARDAANEISCYPPGHPAHTVTVADFVCKYSLPVSGIIFTAGELKVDCLIGLGTDIHFDDDVREIEAIRQRAPFIKTVRIRSRV